VGSSSPIQPLDAKKMTPERIIKGEKTSNQRRIMKFLKLGFEDLGIRVMDSRRDKSSKK